MKAQNHSNITYNIQQNPGDTPNIQGGEKIAR